MEEVTEEEEEEESITPALPPSPRTRTSCCITPEGNKWPIAISLKLVVYKFYMIQSAFNQFIKKNKSSLLMKPNKQNRMKGKEIY